MLKGKGIQQSYIWAWEGHRFVRLLVYRYTGMGFWFPPLSISV